MQNIKFYLNVMLNRSLFYAKIVQTEGRKLSLLEFYAEVQPILCKDSANQPYIVDFEKIIAFF